MKTLFTWEHTGDRSNPWERKLDIGKGFKEGISFRAKCYESPILSALCSRGSLFHSLWTTGRDLSDLGWLRSRSTNRAVLRNHCIVIFLYQNNILGFPLGALHTYSGVWPLDLCQVCVPPHEGNLQTSQKVVDHTLNICAISAQAQCGALGNTDDDHIDDDLTTQHFWLVASWKPAVGSCAITPFFLLMCRCALISVSLILLKWGVAAEGSYSSSTSTDLLWRNA